MRRAARIDENQPGIVKALREIGVSVADTSGMGAGFLDLVCGFRGRNYMLEVKNGDLPSSRRKLTEDERRFHDGWCGAVHVVNNVDEAIRVVTLRGEV